MQKLLLIGLGGFVGTLMRYWLAGVVARRYGATFPLGTLAVNAIGCLLAGFIFYFVFDRFLTGPNAKSVILIGILGGFTTFSSYGLQTFELLRDGELFLALANILLSNVVCLALVWLGYSVAKVF